MKTSELYRNKTPSEHRQEGQLHLTIGRDQLTIVDRPIPHLSALVEEVEVHALCHVQEEDNAL